MRRRTFYNLILTATFTSTGYHYSQIIHDVLARKQNNACASAQLNSCKKSYLDLDAHRLDPRIGGIPLDGLLSKLHVISLTAPPPLNFFSIDWPLTLDTTIFYRFSATTSCKV